MRTTVSSLNISKVIASLNTRVNAIRTLQSRISLLKSYVSGISPSSENPQGESSAQLNHSVLRDINSLLSNLSLLTPHENSAFATEALAQNNDVNLVALLGQLSQSISDIKDVGKRTAIVANSRRTAAARKGQGIPSRYEDDIMAGAGIAP
jgi:COP9 signalosome complex subunit 6